MTIKLPGGEVYMGTALQIARQMQGGSFSGSALSLADYLRETAHRAEQYEDATINLAGSTDEELAASFVSELLREGLAVEL